MRTFLTSQVAVTVLWGGRRANGRAVTSHAGLQSSFLSSVPGRISSDYGINATMHLQRRTGSCELSVIHVFRSQIAQCSVPGI